MRDSEVVSAIVAGDPDGLAEAYDWYADPLYKYCRSLLGDPSGAAEAVQDTFIIAAFWLPELHDPELLRPWLYAVARNECLRAARARKTTVVLDEAPEVTDEGVTISEGAERAELRTLIEDAARGLNTAEREAIELDLWQRLDPTEIAAVLGVSRKRVDSLLSRARDQLLACLGALLVGRGGRDECRELRRMLGDWDGNLTAPIRKRVHRHIERCPVCTARRAYELRPAMLLGLSPGAAVIAGAEENFRLSAGAPAGLKAHTIALALGRSPSAVAHRATVLGRAGSFGQQGFPKPLRPPAAGLPSAGGNGDGRSSARGRATLAGLVLAAAIAGVAIALAGNTGHGTAGGGPGPSGARASAAVAATPDKTGPATRPATSPGPAATRTKAASPTATPTKTASPTVTPSPTASPSPIAGTLVVDPPGGQLSMSSGAATIRLTAQGGPVTWSITVSGGGGHLNVSQSAGTLRTGSSVTVSISSNPGAFGRQLTVNPGHTVFTIVSDNSQDATAARPAVSSAISLVASPFRVIAIWLQDGTNRDERATVTTCATAKLSRPSWLVIQRDSPRPTTGTRTHCSVTATRCCPSLPTPPTRCRTHSSSPPPGCPDFVTPNCYAPGCTPSRATSACAG